MALFLTSLAFKEHWRAGVRRTPSPPDASDWRSLVARHNAAQTGMMMGTMPLDATNQPDPLLDRVFIERERNRFAGRALSFLVLLNGGAALVVLAVLAAAPEGSVDSKISAALMFFSGGAMAGLLSAFIAYINRSVSLDTRERPGLRRILLALALLSVIGSGAAFLTGMNMVGAASTEKTSSHPKAAKEKPSTAPAEPTEPTDKSSAPKDRSRVPRERQPAPSSTPSERAELPRGETAF